MHSKPTLVMTFYNNDPLMSHLTYARPIIDAASTSSLAQTFNNPNIIHKQLVNYDKTTISTILQYAKCIGHKPIIGNIISNQPTPLTIRHHLPEPSPRISSLLPPRTLETHAKIFIFVGAITRQPINRTFTGNIHNDLSPCLNLADGTSMSITSDIIAPVSSPCPFSVSNNEPNQPIIFIFLSTRANPQVHILPPVNNSRSMEIWSIFNKYADSTHGFSSIKALRNIQSADLSQPIRYLFNKVQDQQTHTTGISLYKYGTFTHDSLIRQSHNASNRDPCCFRCFPFLD